MHVPEAQEIQGYKLQSDSHLIMSYFTHFTLCQSLLHFNIQTYTHTSCGLVELQGYFDVLFLLAKEISKQLC